MGRGDGLFVVAGKFAGGAFGFYLRGLELDMIDGRNGVSDRRADEIMEHKGLTFKSGRQDGY